MTYRLEVSQSVLERIRLLADSALAQRQSRRYFDGLAQLNDILIHSPKESGEPLRDYAALNLVEYRLTVDPIHVFYSVDDSVKSCTCKASTSCPIAGSPNCPDRTIADSVHLLHDRSRPPRTPPLPDGPEARSDALTAGRSAFAVFALLAALSGERWFSSDGGRGS